MYLQDTVTQTNACWVFQLTVMASTVQGNTTAKGKKGQKGKKPERVWGIPALIRHVSMVDYSNFPLRKKIFAAITAFIEV